MTSKVLIVDDNANNIRLLRDILEDENYIVYTLDSGLSVLQVAQENKPDIILLDIMMPGIDGFEVCRRLKEESTTQEIPIIMITAKTDSRDIKNALGLGAFDYIKKPVDEIEVIARVQSALRFKRYQDQLREIAMKDGLTGVYNRNLLLELLEKEYIKSERIGDSLAFAMLDIDYFKGVNDTYGHMIGDLVLKEMACKLSGTVRKSDVVGRYGGEEFSIILPGLSKEDAFQLCDRIRKNIETHRIPTEIEDIFITVSIGIYVREKDEQVEYMEMVKRADEALYKSKSNGRNRVELYKAK